MTETGTAGARMRRPVEQEEVSAQSSEEGAQPRPQPGLRRQPPRAGSTPSRCFQPVWVPCFSSSRTLTQCGFKSKLQHVVLYVTLGDSRNLSKLQSPRQRTGAGTFPSPGTVGVK